jgi:hypothetical protein
LAARGASSCSAFLLLVISCCATADDREPVLVGRIESEQVTEASGIARSTLHSDRFWVINDGGSLPVLHAIGADGRNEGSLRLEPASNLDWEAIASFVLDGKSWLLVADAGDNSAIRDHSTIYVVEEPALGDREGAIASPAWTMSFRWPDGARDCEAVAVDTRSERILLLSKRTIPAVLYELPLRPGNADVIDATRLGNVDALPQPTARDLERAAPERNWHWQPTAMDLSADAGAAVILTYRAVYHFARRSGEPWIEALRKAHTVIDLEGVREAEAVAFTADGRSVIVTVEAPSAPLYRLALSPSVTEAE